MIIAIDGPAGSGKSTVAKRLAERLGFHYLDTGAMYRCITWLALERGVALDDGAGLAALARAEKIVFSHEPGKALPSKVVVADTDVTAAIREQRIDAHVSAVAAVSDVRAALVVQQRAMAAESDVVMEGRDIGTVVFPNAEVKVFLTADAEERARRRALQNAERGVGETDEAAILSAIKARDEADSAREASPLVAAPDAVMFNSTGLSIEQVCDKIAALAKQARS